MLGSSSTAMRLDGETTSGRANRAWALIGTTSSASTSGHTTGPPAEKAYAVDPVGVAATTPSHPQRESGRASTSTSTSSILSRLDFSTEASLSAQVRAHSTPSRVTTTSRVVRSSTDQVRSTTARTTLLTSSTSASARNPTCPRFTPSSGTS